MKEHQTKEADTEMKHFRYENGRFYFTARAERTFYFVLTLFMLMGGVVYKLWT